MKITKTITKEYMKERLSSDLKWALKALTIIYNRQTQDEKASEQTTVENGVGFTGTDAELLTSFAKQYLDRKFLTPKQMKLLFKKMPKYWSQILEISDLERLQSLVTAWHEQKTAQQNLLEPVKETV